MMKATEFWVAFDFAGEKPMSIKTGFKTYDEAERWSILNTIDGKVEAWTAIDDSEEEA